jgi:hypothetical protein
MSRKSRARELSALTTISHQEAVQHLSRLDLGPRDEREYVNSLVGGGVVHRQTCVCKNWFFTAADSATQCPPCTKREAEEKHSTPAVVTTATPTANPGAPETAPSDGITEAAHQMNRQLRETMDAADLAGKRLRETMDAADRARRLQEVEMSEKAHSARSLHDMMSASDPARRLQEMKMAEKAHSARSLQEMMDAADPGKPK